MDSAPLTLSIPQIEPRKLELFLKLPSELRFQIYDLLVYTRKLICILRHPYPPSQPLKSTDSLKNFILAFPVPALTADVDSWKSNACRGYLRESSFIGLFDPSTAIFLLDFHTGIGDRALILERGVEEFWAWCYKRDNFKLFDQFCADEVLQKNVKWLRIDLRTKEGIFSDYASDNSFHMNLRMLRGFDALENVDIIIDGENEQPGDSSGSMVLGRFVGVSVRESMGLWADFWRWMVWCHPGRACTCCGVLPVLRTWDVSITPLGPNNLDDKEGDGWDVMHFLKEKGLSADEKRMVTCEMMNSLETGVRGARLRIRHYFRLNEGLEELPRVLKNLVG